MKILITILLSAFYLSAGSQPNQMRLKGHIEGCKATSILIKGVYTSDSIQVDIKNGKFKAKYTIDEPVLAQLQYEGAKDRQLIILEKGDLQLSIDTLGRYTIEGGHYNNLLINSWKNDPEVIRLKERWQNNMKSGQGVSRSLKDQAYYQKQNRKLLFDYYYCREDKIVTLYTHEDPYVRLLAIALNRFGPKSTNVADKLAAIEQEIGSNALISYYRQSVQKQVKKEAYAQTFAVGKPFLNFSAVSLTGEDIELSDVIKDNQFTLLEMWASWCGPCRGEIPYLKEVYKNYNEKGFEIYSFSLDTNSKAWKKASMEEEIVWINTCDLEGFKSPIAKQYGVDGVPFNILIDKKGIIVAKNLRGLELGEKLSDLVK